MNFRVDVIVIGDSTSGHDILNKLASSKSTLKVAFVSRSFKSTTTHDYANVKYFKDEVEYVSYRHRLFCCYTKNGDNIFCTHLIVASGLSYEPFVVNNEQVPGVANSLDEVSKAAKQQSALVVGDNDSAVKLALAAAKKYKQVYLCTQTLDLKENISAATMKKVAVTENLATLPNTTIRKVVVENNSLKKVELDNYSEVDCSAIYVKTAAKPAIEFIPKKLIQREDDYLIVNENCESAIMPKCFAVGTVIKKYNKTMEQKLIDTILKDF